MLLEAILRKKLIPLYDYVWKEERSDQLKLQLYAVRKRTREAQSKQKEAENRRQGHGKDNTDSGKISIDVIKDRMTKGKVRGRFTVKRKRTSLRIIQLKQ